MVEVVFEVELVEPEGGEEGGEVGGLGGGAEEGEDEVGPEGEGLLALVVCRGETLRWWCRWDVGGREEGVRTGRFYAGPLEA